MIKKTSILLIPILFCTFVFSNLNAQNNHCGTVLSQKHINIELSRKKTRNKFSNLKKINKIISVTVHIVGDSTGNTNIEEDVIKEGFDKLNEIFEPIGLSFNICTFLYIENFQYNNFDSEEHEMEVLTKYYTANNLNVYYTNLINEKLVFGYTSAPLAEFDFMFLTKESIKANTLIHQMGHFFNLYHTHEEGMGAELVDGSNCKDAGDLCCDTPAEPDLTNLMQGCTYKSELKDANGDYYVPSVANFMGYGIDICQCHFTKEQYLRMIDCFYSYKTHLW